MKTLVPNLELVYKGVKGDWQEESDVSDEMGQSDTKFEVGEDLYGVSVDELNTRVRILKAEILRLEAELTKKSADLSAADLLFKAKS